jgi:glucosyl-3-phosphoglycerate synthase
MFVRSVRVAAKSFLENPLTNPLIPNWNRVQSALPEFFGDLQEAVEADNA